MQTQVIVRAIVLAVALLNQILVMFGFNPLPWSDEQVYEGVTAVFTVAATLWAWYKNNSITEEAKAADEYLRELKERKKYENQ